MRGVPGTVGCGTAPAALESQLRARLMQELLETSARAKSASAAFSALMKETPSGLHASHELSLARTEMEKAHSRLNIYLSRGILLDDDKMRVSE